MNKPWSEEKNLIKLAIDLLELNSLVLIHLKRVFQFRLVLNSIFLRVLKLTIDNEIYQQLN
ncbi:hypothetical protein O9G_002838 [Rozella allomycis CSF55]|uniref:Uncharacterized protein n=1 Tax=Rozella allomycis (strain CSF55) TaxID=988480 RepID=A0A075ARW6_ROZAC|nr:hypothetical protein O9G_002838 [Rozella allomycis CSF55]|eukprot:EPZ32920.1 hypothetical protein O9G_002838 [Rozella allomycis CSF55]